VVLFLIGGCLSTDDLLTVEEDDDEVDVVIMLLLIPPLFNIVCDESTNSAMTRKLTLSIIGLLLFLALVIYEVLN
jgi:hypothetical protein